MGSTRTVAIASEKGGVGKTTVTLNLALAMARRGWKTLVVDTDPQGAISLSLNKELGASRGLLEFAREERKLAELMLSSRIPELTFLPVGRDDPDAEDAVDGETLDRLFYTASETHDLVLLDTPSGLQGRTAVVLRSVDAALIPMQAEPLSLRTLQTLLDRIASIREETGLHLAGIVLTMVQSRDPVSLATVQEIWSLLPSEVVFDAFVPRDAAFLRASAHGVPVSLLSRRRPPAVASVFDRLAAEFEERLQMTREDEEDVVHLVD